MNGVFMMLRGQDYNNVIFSAALPQVSEQVFLCLWNQVGALAYQEFTCAQVGHPARCRYEIEVTPLLDGGL